MIHLKSLLLVLFVAFSVTACYSNSQNQSTNPKITESELAEHIKTLASDVFGGREPGTPGAEKTVDYITGQFRKAGLEPANDGSWYQKVPLVSITLDPNTTVMVEGLDQPVTLQHGGKTVVWTKRVTDQVSLENSDLVFVGYGIVAPEYNWNDYEGLDAEGKTVVILVNDPGYATQNPELFTGNKMTYYGRWTYKYEEAARQGAAGQDRVIIPEPTPEKGFYFRSDHFNFAKKGVPALYSEAGIDYAEGGKERGKKLQAEYIAERYHKPADEYNPDWDLSGMAANLKLFYQVGNTLAGSTTWPGWMEDVSFGTIRQKTAGMRQEMEQND